MWSRRSHGGRQDNAVRKYPQVQPELASAQPELEQLVPQLEVFLDRPTHQMQDFALRFAGYRRKLR